LPAPAPFPADAAQTAPIVEAGFFTMADVTFYPIRSRSDRESQWKTSNVALGRFVRRHRSRLRAAEDLAHAIERRLGWLFTVMDELCRNCCPWCPEPCCIVNKVWFDFRDLLFFHLLQLPIPPAQLNCGHDQACRYLTHRGCAMPRIIRPWACNQYVCGTQTRFMAAWENAARSALRKTTDAISHLRIDMENAVVQSCRMAKSHSASLNSSDDGNHPVAPEGWITLL